MHQRIVKYWESCLKQVKLIEGVCESNQELILNQNRMACIQKGQYFNTPFIFN